jgi:putative PIN family toxin of toxin-antitoxin system
VVIDTDVFVAGVRSPGGASAELLRRVLSGGPKLLASVPLFVEYEAVATRAEHLSAAGARVEDVVNLLDALAGVAEPVELHFRWRPQLRDAGDELVLEVAVNGRADAIVTFNRRDFGPASRFGIPVLLPREALKGA